MLDCQVEHNRKHWEHDRIGESSNYKESTTAKIHLQTLLQSNKRAKFSYKVQLKLVPTYKLTFFLLPVDIHGKREIYRSSGHSIFTGGGNNGAWKMRGTCKGVLFSRSCSGHNFTNQRVVAKSQYNETWAGSKFCDTLSWKRRVVFIYDWRTENMLDGKLKAPNTIPLTVHAFHRTSAPCQRRVPPGSYKAA